MADNYSQQMQSALNPGIQLALPQYVKSVPKIQSKVSSVKYDPEKLDALKKALGIKRPAASRGELLANALANTPEVRSYKGGFGEEIINPWEIGLSSLARGFGSVYGAALANKREIAEKEREDAIKAAQLDLEASKQNVEELSALDWMKVNDPNAEQKQQQENQKAAALDALHKLKNIGDASYWDRIGAWNNDPSSIWNSARTSEILGEREQALSALLPMTNSIARASGGSGINTVGEMMAYLGVPENATSAQIRGALPGLVKKLGLESEFYQRSPVAQDQISAWEKFMKGTK